MAALTSEKNYVEKHSATAKRISETQNQKTNSPSSEKVHFLESATNKYMSGVRKPISSRRDTGLYKRYKQVAKAVYGSVCRADELYMIALIETVEKGVHFSNTMNQPIQIEKIVIERNLRPRRALEVAGEEETTKEVMEQIREKQENVRLEGHYGEVRVQWAKLKDSARQYHLREAAKHKNLKNAKLLLDLVKSNTLEVT